MSPRAPAHRLCDRRAAIPHRLGVVASKLLTSLVSGEISDHGEARRRVAGIDRAACFDDRHGSAGRPTDMRLSRDAAPTTTHRLACRSRRGNGQRRRVDQYEVVSVDLPWCPFSSIPPSAASTESDPSNPAAKMSRSLWPRFGPNDHCGSEKIRRTGTLVRQAQHSRCRDARWWSDRRDAGWRFSAAGLRVALLEAGRVGRGSTAASTALLMQEPDEDFSALRARYGGRATKGIWKLNRSATRDLIQTLRRLDISCGLELRDSVYFTLDESAQELWREYQCRHRSGVPGRFTR